MLSIGTRLHLSGGYDFEPRWLTHGDHHLGTVIAFIPGQNAQPAAVVKLGAPITVEGTTGDIVVLELRYVGATWKETETVHVELCEFNPEPKAWLHRRLAGCDT